jgi:endonuclease YncB( thermonuclease family)
VALIIAPNSLQSDQSGPAQSQQAHSQQIQSQKSQAQPIGFPQDQPHAKLRRGEFAGPFQAELVRVIDGDTFEARVRIWFGQEITTLVRIRGIDAPELKARCGSEASKARRFMASSPSFPEG